MELATNLLKHPEILGNKKPTEGWWLAAFDTCDSSKNPRSDHGTQEGDNNHAKKKLIQQNDIRHLETKNPSSEKRRGLK